MKTVSRIGKARPIVLLYLRINVFPYEALGTLKPVRSVNIASDGQQHF